MIADELLAIIPARGGSKGLPGKNLVKLGGIPLLAWTRDAVDRSSARNAPRIVSTDSDEIAATARELGLHVPFLRPPHLATDEASAVDVALHAVEWYEQKEGSKPPAVMWLQPTSPFRPPSVVTRAVETFGTTDRDAVVGVSPIHRTLSTLFHANVEMHLRPLESAAEIETRRQAVRTMFTPNGGMYLIDTDVLRRERTFLPKKSLGLEMNPLESLDLDDRFDLAVMRAVCAAGITWRDV